MQTTAAQLAKILGDLGDTVDRVATRLKDERIQGVRNAVRLLNPIVRFVQGYMLISNLGMDVMDPSVFRLSLLNGMTVETPLPEAIRDFLDAFNAGAYPDLEMPVGMERRHPANGLGAD